MHRICICLSAAISYVLFHHFRLQDLEERSSNLGSLLSLLAYSVWDGLRHSRCQMDPWLYLRGCFPYQRQHFLAFQPFSCLGALKSKINLSLESQEMDVHLPYVVEQLLTFGECGCRLLPGFTLGTYQLLQRLQLLLQHFWNSKQAILKGDALGQKLLNVLFDRRHLLIFISLNFAFIDVALTLLILYLSQTF